MSRCARSEFVLQQESRFVVLVCIFNEVSQELSDFSRDFKSDVTVGTKDGPKSAPLVTSYLAYEPTRDSVRPTKSPPR